MEEKAPIFEHESELEQNEEEISINRYCSIASLKPELLQGLKVYIEEPVNYIYASTFDHLLIDGKPMTDHENKSCYVSMSTKILLRGVGIAGP